MIKSIKIFINPLIALIFLCSIISSANVIEYSKSNNYCVENAVDNVGLDDFNTDYLPSGENNNEEIMLLNGKYAVMTDRSERPKTKINYNETPEPSPSFYTDIPPQFSWKDYGGDWTTPAKDQGNCGSCWAFSALSAMEAAINIASGYPDTDLDLSEQYILSCLPYGGSCNGGWTDDAFEAIINTGPIGNYINGVPLESCMPYTQTDYLPCGDKCENWNFTELSENGVLWELESWGANHNLENDDPSDRDIVKGYLMDFGPMSTSMYATSGFSNYFNTHHDPNDWYWEEDYSYTNHAVLLLGWKDDSSVTNGGYWILKNSWGTGFGYEGYFNVAYGGLKIAEIVRWCFTPEWPQPSDDDDDDDGPGPIWPPMHVFADFSYGPDYPKLGTTIEFDDTSQGNVVLREWDLNGDGVIDSNANGDMNRCAERA